jgi:ribosomal protein S18 acetylase RimI-like enzyme
MGTNGGRGASSTDGHDLTIRPGSETDAPAVASLHAGQIAEGFLSFLGPGFLARLYRRIVRSAESFLLVAESEGRVVGFIAGTADVAGLYRTFLWRDGPGAALGVAGRLLRSWRRVIETLRHGSGDGVGRGVGVELLAIAVDPGCQGRGVGGALVGAFLTRVQADRGGAAYVVVAADNAGAIALYRRAGFEAGDPFELHRGTASLLMQWRRAPQAGQIGASG